MKRTWLLVCALAACAHAGGGCDSSDPAGKDAAAGSGGTSASGGSGGTAPGAGGSGGGAGASAAGGTGPGGTGGVAGSDPLAGSWESEYVTSGQRDSFTFAPNLTGSGTYYSVIPGVACAVTINAQRGLGPGKYVGLVNFSAPCSALMPMLAFSCTLTDGNNRFVCEGDKNYRRVGSPGAGGAGGSGGTGAGGQGGSGPGGTGGTSAGTGGTSAGTGGSGGAPADPLVGSWESEYVTQGQRDTFVINPALTGSGTYYSIVPGTACSVDITAQRGLSAGNYVGTLRFGPPCSLVMPQGAFSCTLEGGGNRLTCDDTRAYRRK